MENLFKRTVSSLVLIFIVFGMMLILKPIFLSIIISGFIMLVFYEYWEIVNKKAPGIMKIMYFFSAFGIMLASCCNNFIDIAVCSGLALLFLSAMLTKIDFKKSSKYLVSGLFGLIYVGILGIYLIKLGYLPQGAFLLVYLIFIVKTGDIGAYIFGSKFGTIKIMPRISPKKSLQGCIAGMITSVLCGLALNYIYSLFNIFLFNNLELVILTAILNVIAQFGDMCESVLKRGYDIKDSGGVIPGIGGLLDLVDSLVFAVPVLYFYLV